MTRVAGILLLIATTTAGGGQRVDVTPGVVLPSVAGRDSFNYYCASCHGRSGRGNGPVASALKTPPTDLTRLAANNGGQFPAEQIKTIITDGRSTATAHGSPDMPVWGPIFQALDPSDRIARARIEHLVFYIDALQVQ